MILRQGDVRIEKIDAIPLDAIRQNDNIVMRGEATGHAHRVTGGKARLFILPDKQWIYMQVTTKEAVLSHEEHPDIILPMGEYKISPQIEWDWFNEEVRRTID